MRAIEASVDWKGKRHFYDVEEYEFKNIKVHWVSSLWKTLPVDVRLKSVGSVDIWGGEFGLRFVSNHQFFDIHKSDIPK